MNASIDDAAQEIVYKNYYNIGIATDTDHGLYVPNVKNADTKGMFKIADEINEKQHWHMTVSYLRMICGMGRSQSQILVL